jgi:hypothetical protein
MALGVLAHATRERQVAAGGAAVPDELLESTLADELRNSRGPGLIGALGVALGLAGATDAAEAMRERLVADVAKEQMAGYLCIGLALMNDRASIDQIHRVMGDALRRPRLLVQAAIALGKLGDRTTAEFLLARMADEHQNLATLAACASALGFIGDRRSIAPLVDKLLDDELGGLARAFAGAALGGVCDRYELPWNTPISVGINYGANVETLTAQTAGVLDIL